MHKVCGLTGREVRQGLRPDGASTGHNDMDATNTASTTIQYDDFAKLELRVATVIECKAHPNADKLLVLQIDLGTEKRQICAGLRQHYAPEQLVGKQIVVVANLAPRTMRGEVSQGMLLAATDAASGKVIFLTPSEAVAVGSKVS
jgi:methionine--tRNA ligase beta chain